MLVSCESSYCRILSLKRYLMFNIRTLKEGLKNARGFRNIIGQYNLITTVILMGKSGMSFVEEEKGTRSFRGFKVSISLVVSLVLS